MHAAYIILQAPVVDQLERMVNEHLRSGWEVSGGLAVVTHPHQTVYHENRVIPYTLFYQAMTFCKECSKNQMVEER